MAQPTHKIFIDDSGTKEYAPDGRYSTTGGVSPYFVFAGVLMTIATAGATSAALRKLKRACFKRDDVELKANWLRFRPKREAKYLAPFRLSDADLDAFVDAVYDLIVSTDCKLIAAIVDKQQVIEAYGSRAFYAPAIAYEILMQRVQMEMTRVDGICHVTIDDMTGATPNGRQYRTNLERHHKRLTTHGSTLQRGMAMDRLAGQSFADSKHDERIQLADLVAYNVNRQFIEHGAEWDGDAARLDTYEALHRMAPRFCAEPTHGYVSGWGIVKFPNRRKQNWAPGR